MQEICNEIIWVCMAAIFIMAALAGLKATIIYIFVGSNRIRMTPPTTVTATTTTVEVCDDLVADRGFGEPSWPIRVEPVQAVKPVKVQPVKSVLVQPTIQVPTGPVIECAKCGKQIKSPPLQKGNNNAGQYKCEHCGTVVALA